MTDRSSLAIPARLGDVTPAWMTRVLAPHVPGALVERVTLAGVTDGTTARAIVRLEGRGALPPSLFLKLAPRDRWTRVFVGALGLGQTEVAFYRQARAGLAARAPRVYHAAAARWGPGFALLLEDLRVRGCRFGDVTTALSMPEAEAVMRAFASLHGGWWEHPSFEAGLVRLAADARALRFRVGRVLSRLAWRPALARHGDCVPTPLHGAAGEVSRRRLALEAAWARPPRTLIHGDAHLGNLYFDGDEVGLLDWQVSQRGQGMRDVAYFLANSVPVEVRRAREAALLEVYLEALAASGGPRVPLAHAWEQYRLHVLYAWIAALVTAAATSLQHEAVVRAALERTSAAVLDLDALGAMRALA
ncbi:MAG: phosphotransferase [Deltaproteobacteria bacterium]|nr:phosphotransferase [Deltaproteobacteria bacterium]